MFLCNSTTTTFSQHIVINIIVKILTSVYNNHILILGEVTFLTKT